jgi:hypothetical protein
VDTLPRKKVPMAEATGGELILKVLAAVERLDGKLDVHTHATHERFAQLDAKLEAHIHATKEGFAETGRQLGDTHAWLDRVDLSIKGLSTDVRRVAHVVNGLADQLLARDERMDETDKRLTLAERTLKELAAVRR